MTQRRVWTWPALLAVTLLASPGCLALVDFQETCQSDSDCPSGNFCNNNHCSGTCNKYSNCGAGMQCDAQLNKCTAIPQCTAGNAAQLCGAYACNSSTAHCFSDCRGPNSQQAPSQCSSSTVCTYDYTCRPTCVDTYDPVCVPYLCDTVMGWCANYCMQSVDCASGYTCSSDETCTH